MKKPVLARATVELMNSIIKPTSNSVKLCQVGHLSSFKAYTEIYDLLTLMLQQKNRRHDNMFTFINAIATQRTASFVFSRRIFGRIIKDDPNHKHISIGGDMWASFYNEIVNDSKILQVVEAQAGTRPGFYKLNENCELYRLVAELVGKEILESQLKTNHDFYNSKLLERKPEANADAILKELNLEAKK